LKTEEFLSLRAKNLLWTVSGNHDLKLEIDEEALGSNRERCLYISRIFQELQGGSIHLLQKIVNHRKL